MRSACLLTALMFLTATGAVARDTPDRPSTDLVHSRDAVFAPLADPAAVPADTTYVLGGPGTLSGKFEDVQGQPDWQGWTSIDLTQPTENHWSVSTFHAADLDTITGNHAWWCGDLFESCGPDDPPEGVGNDWYERLRWSGAVADPASGCTVRVRAVFNLDLEPAYDYLYLEVLRPDDYPLQFIYWTGQYQAHPVDESITLAPADYWPGGEVRLRWQVITDPVYSDEDCLWPTAGGCQIDNIAVTFDQGGGEVLQGEVETCEPGSDLQWVPELRQGVGDYAKVWPQLDELDPDQDNATPLVAFIDDGEVEPASDGTPCVTWCYGPGGFIVPPGSGLSDLYEGIDNQIRSPVLALPEGDLGGALLAFDLYLHAPLDQGAPWVLPTWRVRSTADPAGAEGWSEWRWYRVLLWGGPEWLRARHNVTDLLVPGATHVQLALGVDNFDYNFAEDGTPAPYFDNVAFLVHDDPAPAVLHVTADGTGDYATIQEAIYAAAAGDSVLLADGVYTGPGNRDLDYQGKGIVIASASGDPTACILELEGSEAEPHRAVRCWYAGSEASVLAGVTVRGGRETRGAGLYVRGSGLTVERCILVDNDCVGNSRYGGALYSDDSVVVVRDCVFADSEAEFGAAIAIMGASEVTISGSLFRGNKALDEGSGIFRQSGSPVTVEGCTFVDNREQLNRGTITLSGWDLFTVSNTIIAFTQLGSAVHCNSGAIEFSCSDLYANHAGDWTDCIADQLGQAGNLSADPRFCLDANPTDPHGLDAASPCAPANQPDCGLIGARPVACDGAVAAPDVPLATRLLPAAPNPFNPHTTLRFDLAVAGPVELAVFDLGGRRIRVLVAGELPAGPHEAAWDGRTDTGRAAASGTYLVRLVAAGRTESRRIALLK